MTIYDKIRLLDEDQMAEFMYHFANDVINAFSNYIMPSQDTYRKFLDTEVPNG